MHFQAILKIFGFKQIKIEFQYIVAVEMLVYKINKNFFFFFKKYLA